MNSGIYKIRNTINDKIYVGSAKDFDKRWKRHLKTLRANKHHNIRLQRSFNIHGELAFVFEIIERTEYVKGIQLLEQYYIDIYNSKVNGYNIADASFGDVMTHNPNRESIIEKRRQTQLDNNKLLTDEQRKNIWGKLGELNGRWNPDIHNYCKGCGKRISNGLNLLTESTNRHIWCFNCRPREGKYNPFYGKKHSQKVLDTIANANKGRVPPNHRIVIIDDIEYNSITEAGRQLGIHPTTVLYRLNSPNKKFVNYKFKESLTTIENTSKDGSE